MSAGWLTLKFQDQTKECVCGDARITAQGVEIITSCATIGELRVRVHELKQDLDAILRQAEREFARCQGGGRSAGT